MFSELLKKSINKYNTRGITSEIAIRELIELAKDMKTMKEEGEELGLTVEEKAFYDVISKNSDEDERVIEAGCGKIITDKKQFYRELRLVLKDESYRNKLSENCRKVFENSLGTADKIVNKLLNE